MLPAMVQELYQTAACCQAVLQVCTCKYRMSGGLSALGVSWDGNGVSQEQELGLCAAR